MSAIEITGAAEAGTRMASAEYFTGKVWMEPIPVVADAPPMGAVRVTFTPGARTNWHTHPLGQTLHVLTGVGLVQVRGEPARLIREGDTVRIPKGVEHWHGAVAGRAMTHLAMQHKENDETAEWLEPVSDADYAAAQP